MPIPAFSSHTAKVLPLDDLPGLNNVNGPFFKIWCLAVYLGANSMEEQQGGAITDGGQRQWAYGTLLWESMKCKTYLHICNRSATTSNLVH